MNRYRGIRPLDEPKLDRWAPASATPAKTAHPGDTGKALRGCTLLEGPPMPEKVSVFLRIRRSAACHPWSTPTTRSRWSPWRNGLFHGNSLRQPALGLGRATVGIPHDARLRGVGVVLLQLHRNPDALRPKVRRRALRRDALRRHRHEERSWGGGGSGDGRRLDEALRWSTPVLRACVVLTACVEVQWLRVAARPLRVAIVVPVVRHVMPLEQGLLVLHSRSR
mmetsp:Transcript_15527/g.42892  ORF Transcript_15527/g.42892 Transcript_15527/m.42892 type:complete len:223 (-) Transcript_15527:357-1025(-)